MAKCYDFRELPANMAYVQPLLSDYIPDGIPQNSFQLSHHVLRRVCTECLPAGVNKKPFACPFQDRQFQNPDRLKTVSEIFACDGQF